MTTASETKTKPVRRRWDDIDPPVRGLVRALKAFAGFRTVESCGGHEDPLPGQWAAGSWVVIFDVAHTEPGRYALECLVWAVTQSVGGAGGEWFGRARSLLLQPCDAPERPPDPADPWAWAPPWTRWVLEGRDGEDPDALAARLDAIRTAGQEEW